MLWFDKIRHFLTNNNEMRLSRKCSISSTAIGILVRCFWPDLATYAAGMVV